MNYEGVCNIRIIGDSTIGKTSIIYRFIDNIFESIYTETVGFMNFSKDEIICDRKIRIKIWDTAGQERYRSLTKTFFRNSQGIILCYDVTNKNTFYNLKFWLESLKCCLGTLSLIKIIIIGNKIDLTREREVTFEEADDLCKENGFTLFETSAKDNINIRESIIYLTELIIKEKLEMNVLERNSFKLNGKREVNKSENQGKKNCCAK